MTNKRRGNGDNSGRQILRKIEHKTHISETIEEFDPETGRIIRREVRTKDIDAKITEDDHPYPASHGIESGKVPLSSDPSAPIRIPEQWKVSVFDAYVDAPLSVADFAGDYVVSRVPTPDDDQIAMWESAFVECQGLSCMRVTAKAEHQQLKLTAEFAGSLQGPRWTGVVSNDLQGPIQLQRDRSVSPADIADVDWPLTVTLVAMGQSFDEGGTPYDTSPRYISPEPTASMRAMMAGGGNSSSSSAPSNPPFVPPPCQPGICCLTSPPGTNSSGTNSSGEGPGTFDMPTSYSMSPVRYFDGQLSLSATDLSSEGFGFPWGQTRSYSNKLDALDEGLGYNWIGGADPYLVEDGVNSRIAVVHSADSTTWFEDNSGSFSPLLGSLSSLTYDSGNSQFKYTDEYGQVTIFNDFNDLNRPGMFIKFQSQGGNSITVTATSGEMITEMQRSQTVDGVTTTDSFVYTYGSSGASLNRLESVVWRQKVDAGAWNNILRVNYSYYGDSESFGSLGDLKAAVRGEWNGTSWSTLGTSYYRYYKSGDTNGFEHGLRYALNEQAFQNLSDDPNVSDPFTASNALVSLYADYYFEYDSQQWVTKESIKGGSQTFTFSYDESSNADDVNNWKRKTVETLPDGTIKTVYTNYVGQPLLQDFQSGSDHWLSYIEYNSDSQVILRATPAAITSYNDSSANLNVVLKSSEGLIHLTEYYASTGSGGAKGYLKSRKLKEGSSGTAVVLNLMEYTSHSAGGSTIYPVSKETTYTNDDGTGAVSTEYSRTYHSGTVQIDQKTTTLPAILSSQNGSGTSNSFVEVFDIDGYLTWRKDERGFITRFKYNTATGAMIQRIDDVDTAQVADEPSGWVTPAGGGLHLITDYEFDDQGRITQKLGPAHTIDLGGTATEIRTATWNVYKDPEFRTVVGTGYQKTSDSSFTLVNPVSITKRDKNGNLLEIIQATRASTSGKLQPTDTFAQSSYTRWTTHQYTDCCLLASTRVYKIVPSSGEGTSGTNYDQTNYGYDNMKRRNRSVTPGGTITFMVYDARSQVISIYAGTDDTGATQTDPTGGGTIGNNMVIISSNQYDGGNDGGNGNLTQETQYVSASETRITSYEYDWRDRQTVIDGEIDFYQTIAYNNRNQVVKTERYDTTSSGNLVNRIIAKFDDLGRTYQTVRYAVDPSTGTVGNALTDNIWYSETGQVIKQLPSGSSLFSKMTYDGLGRKIKEYSGYDLTETSYADAGNVTGDTLLEQNFLIYDDASNTIEVAAYQRFHDATGTGELNGPSGAQPKARVSYSATYPDGVGRITATANYGTSGGSSFSRSATIPNRSDDILVTSNTYDDAGNLFETTDPAGMVVRRTYDDVGRDLSMISNYVASPSGSDENVTVSTTYNADGNVATLTANNTTTGNQTTTYVYGTTLIDSGIATSTLLRAEEYPDKSSATDRVEFTYNRQIERTGLTDQNGTIHEYDYDKLGRMTQDRATTVGSGVNANVRRISTTYEVRGMVETVTSYDNSAVGAGNVVNDIEYVYNDFGQLITQYQQLDGAVNTSTSPKTQYAFANGANNTIRLTKLTYPDGRELNYSYGTIDGTDDAASRIESLIDNDGTTHMVDYEYLGAGSIVETDYAEPDVRNQLFDAALSGDIYTSLDRFGRQIDCRWEDYGSSTDAAQIKYGYDRSSNRTWREDVVAATNSKSWDELYAYDGVNRLIDMQRGDLNAGKTAITNLKFAQEWSLDATGNWSNFKADDNGNSTWDLNQTRTSNVVNEITNITETTGSSWATPSYNPAGNMSSIPKPVDPTVSYDATFDAWNRLVKLEEGANTVAEYEYDGMKRRTISKSYSSGSLSETRHYYYSDEWQVLEERVGTSTNPDRQYVWGQRYIDDCVLRDRDTTADGILDERLYALQDANWNVIALTDENGDVQERYNYSAYGTPAFYDASFTTRSASSYNWETLYAGYHWNEFTKLYEVRNRILHSTLGVWIQRDSLKYLDTLNLYLYSIANPLRYTDSLGMQSSAHPPGTVIVITPGGDIKTFPPNTSPRVVEGYISGHPGSQVIRVGPDGTIPPPPEELEPFMPRPAPPRRPGPCEKCEGDKIVPDKDKIDRDTKRYNDCITAVNERIGQRLLDAERVYEMALQAIDQEGAKLLRACEQQFDRNSALYHQEVYICQRFVRASMALNRGAAIATYSTIQAALAISLQVGYLECDSLSPCHR